MTIVKLTAATITDAQIRELRDALLADTDGQAGPVSDEQTRGLFACLGALGHTHLRKQSRARCADLLNARSAK